MRQLAHSPHLAGLTSLNLHDQLIRPEGARILAASPLPGRLRRLNLGANHELTDAGLIPLLSAPGAGSLRSLNIDYSSLGPEGVTALLAWGERARPTALCLGSLAPGQAARLAQAPWLAGLTELGVEEGHAAPLLHSPLLRPEVLRCYGTGLPSLPPRGPLFARLHTFDMSHTTCGPQGIAPLLGVDPPRLRALKLWFADIGDDGLAALVRSPLMARLRRLDCRYSGVTTYGVFDLAESPHAAGLRALYLGDCRLYQAALEALADSPYLRGLQELDLSAVGATDPGVDALSCGLPRLRWLNLSSNHQLTDAAARSLAQAAWPLLDRLTLANLAAIGPRERQELGEVWGPRLELSQDAWL